MTMKPLEHRIVTEATLARIGDLGINEIHIVADADGWVVNVGRAPRYRSAGRKPAKSNELPELLQQAIDAYERAVWHQLP